jgi:predicted amidohydrolase
VTHTLPAVVKVAAFQAPLLPSGSIQAALGFIRERLAWCEAEGVGILCCPEAVLGGLADDAARPADVAFDVERGQLDAMLAPLASDTVSTIVGLTETDRSGRLYNSAAVYCKGSVVGVYRKRHPAINRSVYTAGETTPVFTVSGLTFGIVICRDSNFEEPARTMAARGADALFVPTNNGLRPSKGGPALVAEARAADVRLATAHHLFAIRADVAGRAGHLVSYGSSAIVDPQGRLLRSAAPLESDLIVAEISPRSDRPCGRSDPE